jgi:hypothetical protein
MFGPIYLNDVFCFSVVSNSSMDECEGLLVDSLVCTLHAYGKHKRGPRNYWALAICGKRLGLQKGALGSISGPEE